MHSEGLTDRPGPAAERLQKAGVAPFPLILGRWRPCHRPDVAPCLGLHRYRPDLQPAPGTWSSLHVTRTLISSLMAVPAGGGPFPVPGLKPHEAAQIPPLGTAKVPFAIRLIFHQIR